MGLAFGFCAVLRSARLAKFAQQERCPTSVSSTPRRSPLPAKASGTGTARGGSTLKLDLLRGFALLVDDRPVQLPLRSQRVVAFVALNPRPVQRVWVAGNLWMDSPEARAGANLRTALWQLDLTACPVIQVTSTHLAVADGVEVDFRDATRRAQRLLYGTHTTDEEDLPRLCQAGDLLPDWYDDWVLIERERFRQLRLNSLERLCAELTDRGRYPEATEAGLAAVAAEPLRESAHRAVIAAHLAAGNPVEATRQYELCRDLLRRNLGILPSRAMDEVAATLPHR